MATVDPLVTGSLRLCTPTSPLSSRRGVGVCVVRWTQFLQVFFSELFNIPLISLEVVLVQYYLYQCLLTVHPAPTPLFPLLVIYMTASCLVLHYVTPAYGEEKAGKGHGTP